MKPEYEIKEDKDSEDSIQQRLHRLEEDIQLRKRRIAIAIGFAIGFVISVCLSWF